MLGPGRAFAAPPLGARLGPYRLDAELGRGASGVVYRATHAGTGAPVAVKVVGVSAGEAGERFAREVEALARLRHRNVVAIHAAGYEGNLGWLAMELVEGKPLDRVLSRRELEPRRELELLLDVARGVAHAHGRGVVHRDLKPQNVLVSTDGVARVTDFGLAKHLGRETRLTETGAFMGTPCYMAPEQIAGQAPRVDERTDVWALGVMLYEATTGSLPFTGDGVLGLSRAVLLQEPERPRRRAPGVAPDLEAIVLRALEKDPARRYPSMAALADDLERHLRGEPVARRPRPPTLAAIAVPRPSRRSGFVLALLGLALLLGALRHAAVLDAESVESVREASARLESEARAAADRLAGGAAGSLEVAAVTSRELDRLARAAETLAPAGARPAAFEEARAQAARLAATQPRARLALLSARALGRLGEPGPAHARLEAAATDGVHDVALETARGDLALAEGDVAAATRAYAAALALDPRAGDALAGSPRTRARTATAPDDVAALEREVDRLEREADRLERRTSPGAVGLARAAVLAAAGKPAAAHALLRDAPPAWVAAAQRERARLCRAAGDDAGERAALAAAAVADPEAGRTASREDEALGALADAARMLEEVARVEPEDARSAVALAELRGVLGDPERGLADLHRAVLQLERSEAGRARLPAVQPAVAPLERAAAAIRPPESDVRARPRGETAPAAEPRPERALDLEAARLARAGDLAEAARARARAFAARPEAARRAFREGRADAFALLTAEGEPDRPEASVGRRRLATRATAELAYAAALSPSWGEPLGLLARVALAQGDPGAARAHARAALEADPTDPRAALVFLQTADPSFASEEVRATGTALLAAPWPAALELADARARLALSCRETAVALEIAQTILRDHPRERTALMLASDVFKATHDPAHEEARRLLDRCDADRDRVRAKLAESEACVNREERARALAAALDALEILPDDPAALEQAERCERALHRMDAGPQRLEADPVPLEPLAGCALRRRLTPAEIVRHASSLAEDLPTEVLEAAQRRVADAGSPRERLVRQTGLALILGGAAINRLDPRGRLLAALPVATPRLGLAALEPALDGAPDALALHAVHAIHLARCGRRESAARDLDRLLLRRTPGLGEHQLASMVLVLEDDLGAAANHAVLGIALARRSDDAAKAFLADPPFSSIADRPEWRAVRARLGR